MNNYTCPKCKSDEAYGRMGNWNQCLMCGYVDKTPITDLINGEDKK